MAWAVTFHIGGVDPDDKTSTYSLRCVRRGP